MTPKTLTRVVFPVVLLALFSICSAEEINIPKLEWTPRSDWINVKSDITPAAVGDGQADDTAALQAALSQASPSRSAKKTVYLPPGKYKISKTLTWDSAPKGVRGAMLVGAGRDTTILWDGEEGGTMFHSTGASRTRYIGITWDGQKKAAHAYNHASQHSYETRVRHENEAFLNFTVAAITSGGDNVKVPTAETFIWNCLFRNCEMGVVVGEKIYNYYQWIFDGCEFENCGTGISSPCGKIVVLNTHFSNSSQADVKSALSPRLRRCTSVGSNQFLAMGQSGVSAGIAIQDCRIDSWKSTEGAILFGIRGPLQIFDCVFTNPPKAGPVIRTVNAFQQNFIESKNTVPEGCTLIEKKSTISHVSVPAGKLGASLTSANQHFLKTTWPADSKNILDVKAAYGAKGDGRSDDADALQKAVDDARTANNGSIVYLPTGAYKISKTIRVSGGNYKIQSGGLGAVDIEWTGGEEGAMFAVENPQDISIEQIALTCGPKVEGILVTATGASKVKVDGLYYKNPNFYVPPGPGLVLRKLPSGVVVDIPHLDGPLTVDDSAQAQVLLKYSSQGCLAVKGATLPKTGFVGCVTYQGGMIANPNYWDVRVEDNQDLVIGDYYDEQTYNHLFVGGLPGKKDGRVTIQGVKQDAKPDAKTLPVSFIAVDNYGGQVMYSLTWANNKPAIEISQTGENPCDLILMGNSYSQQVPEMKIGGKCRLVSFHNTFVTAKPFEYFPDKIPEGSLQAVANAFDHLRELGAANLKMHYPDLK